MRPQSLLVLFYVYCNVIGENKAYIIDKLTDGIDF